MAEKYQGEERRHCETHESTQACVQANKGRLNTLFWFLGAIGVVNGLVYQDTRSMSSQMASYSAELATIRARQEMVLTRLLHNEADIDELKRYSIGYNTRNRR